MSRTLSSHAKQQIFSQNKEDPLITLLEFNHPDIGGTLRLSDHATTRLSDSPLVYATISNGLTYYYLPITAQLPDEQEERAPVARLVVDNVSLFMVDQLRSVVTPGTCDISMVFLSAPNVTEIQYPILDLKNAQFNKDVVTIEMGMDSLDSEPLPGDEFTPAWFPALFAR